MKTSCKDYDTKIPKSLLKASVTKGFLKNKNVNIDLRTAFAEKFPKGTTYYKLRCWLAQIQREDWENYVKEVFGGDTVAMIENRSSAIGGNYDSVITGDYGTSITGNYGNAISGVEGNSTAGIRGTATTGDYGTSTAGMNGVAIAGNYGVASVGRGGAAIVGENGIAKSDANGSITISYFDIPACRRRLKTGYIGEDGLLPNVLYRLNCKGEFEKIK